MLSLGVFLVKMSNNNNTSNENANSGAGSDISAKITAQGDIVRQLKGDKKPKEEIDAAVKVLLALKVRRINSIELILFDILELIMFFSNLSLSLIVVKLKTCTCMTK